ncbi:hypothetical protein [Stenotrophomonas rhizophila]|uniref:hypothetical protein n=1 Tax=Stenotrophomonas rhizophila TaxID=216778 RepID=UPI0028ACE6CF|nr:hypothetical protein [Stenotrophomonas rhizophila]
MDDGCWIKSVPVRASALAIAGLLAAPLAAACTGEAGDTQAVATSTVESRLFVTGNTEGFATRVSPFDTDAQNRAVLPDVEVSQAPEDPSSERFGAAGGTAIHGEHSDGRWRVCREERWQPRTNSGAARQADAVAPGAEAAKRWSRDFFVGAVRTYRYDAAGRLLEARDVVSPDVLPQAGVAWLVPKSGLLYCARYDGQGRMTWSIDTAGVGRWDPGKVCADLSEDTVDSLRVTYNEDGSVLALLRTRPSSLPEGGGVALMHPDGYSDAGWAGTATFLLPPRQGIDAADNTVSARIAEGRGIASLSTRRKDFAAYDAQPPYHERPQVEAQYNVKVYYDFPDADIPMSAARDGFADLADYPRVRSYVYDKGVRVEEVFAAGRHAPRQRVWRSRFALRQEDYDAAGKLQQVIHYGDEIPGGHAEDLAGAGRRAGFKQVLLTKGGSAYRVYRYDRNGRERLELACWSTMGGAGGVAEEAQCGGADGKVRAEGAAIEGLLRDTYGVSQRRLAYTPM